jgi:NitT/TauT family transport system substrate-binding protein
MLAQRFGLVPLACLSLCLLMAIACAPAAPAAPTVAPKAAEAKPAEAKPAQLKKVRIMQSTIESASFMPIMAARYFNFFQEEGFAADVVTTGGGGPDVAALIAGEAQFTAAGPINQLALLQEGKRTRAVTAFSNVLSGNIVMAKEVFAAKGLNESSSLEQKMAALKGAKISVTRPGALTDMIARSYVRRAGLDPDKDVQIIASTSGQPQMAALEQKAVDAAAVVTPTGELMVERGAAVMLINNTRGEDPFFKPFIQNSILVREDYANSNAEDVRAMARAIIKGNQWVRSHTAEEAAAVMNFYVPFVKKEDLARDLGLVKDTVSPDGCHTEKGIMGNVELFKAAGLLKIDIKWTDLATNEFLPTKCPE